MDLRAAALGLDLQPAPAAPRSAAEERAASLVPARQVWGPIPLRDHLRHLGDETREAWRQLLQARERGAYHTLVELATYWADGKRSLLEIADLVEQESGLQDLELLLAYFDILDELGLVVFQ
jgi:hypothetical protein